MTTINNSITVNIVINGTWFYSSFVVHGVSDKFILETDASGAGVGAVLSVRRGEELLPVAFFSKQLQGAEHRYSAQELEGLGLFKAVRHCHGHNRTRDC